MCWKWSLCMINWPYNYVESNLALRQHFWRYLKCGKIVGVFPYNWINQVWGLINIIYVYLRYNLIAFMLYIKFLTFISCLFWFLAIFIYVSLMFSFINLNLILFD